MKKSKIWIYSLFLSIFIFTVGCNDGNGDDNMDPSPRMTATVDGSDWEAENYGASIVNGMTNVTGITSDGSTITLTISSTQEGSYELTEQSFHVGGYQASSGSIAFTSNGHPDAGGTVNISEINTQDSTISGTFSFSAFQAVGSNWVDISGGEFVDISYIDQIPGGDENSMSVLVDGTLWEPSVVNAQVNSGIILINGSDSQGDQSIGISVNEDISPGTYELGNFSIPIVNYNVDASTNLITVSGTLEITEHDTDDENIKGTFFFDAQNEDETIMVSLTNGTFDVNY